jgi:phosphatidylglycerophosphatase A
MGRHAPGGKRTPDIRFLLAHPAHFIALGFGSGLAPRAPGTFGTLAGLPIAYALLQLDAFALTLALIAMFALGIWACEIAGRNLGVSDHGGIVWDEIVAIGIVLAFVPLTPVAWLLGFALFRIFDILKPWPIRWADAHFDTPLSPGGRGEAEGAGWGRGFGVMLDDLLAAIFTVLLMKALTWLP